MTKFEGGLEIKNLNSVEAIEAEIKVLQSKLEFYKELEKTKSPVEAAYKRVFGAYPATTPSVHNFDDNQWFAFQKGYSCGYGDDLENSNEISKKPVEKQSKTLTDIVYRWWDDVFTAHSDWNMETSVDDLIDQVEQFLPKQKFGSSQNVLGDVDIVEGFNDCLKKIKSKLR